jgi:hypothetical protein
MERDMKRTDTPISPAHYKNEKWEAIEVIEAVVAAVTAATGKPDAAYNVGASLKYLLRAGKKGESLEQVGKAEWHIRRAANLLCSTPPMLVEHDDGA